MAKLEVTRRRLQAMVSNQSVPEVSRQEALKALYLRPAKASVTRVVSRCVATGRARSVNKKTRLSRRSQRALALEGFIPGRYKACW